MRPLIFITSISLTMIVGFVNARAEESDGGNYGQNSSTGIQVVVTASRGTAESPLSIPQTVSVVTQDEIAETEPFDVEAAIKNLPGIGMAPAEGNPNFWQQGFSIRGLGAQRVLTLTDGVRQTGQGVGYGGGNLSLYDTYAIEKIEVLRGPASVMYGTDAFGGVINVISRDPKVREEFGTNVGMRYGYDGQYDRQKAGGYLDIGNAEVSSILGGSYTRSGEPGLPGDADPMGGSFRNVSLWGKVDFHIDGNSDLRLLANSLHTSDVVVLDSDMVLPIAMGHGAPLAVSSPLDFSFPKYDRGLVGAEYSKKGITQTVEEYKTGLYWQWLRRNFSKESAYYPTFSPGFAGPPSFVDPSATVTRSHIVTDDSVDTLEWQNQVRMHSGAHLVSVGMDAGWDKTYLPEEETQTVVAAAGFGLVQRDGVVFDRVRADASQARVGVYVQDDWSIADFKLIPGVRYDYFDVADDQSSFGDTVSGVSGSLGSVYSLSSESSLYSTLSSGFRAPDLGERYQDGIVNFGVPGRVIGNPKLNPERAYTAEVGSKYYGQRFSVDTAVFVNRVSDYIGTKSIGMMDGYATDQYANLGWITLYGLEAASSVQVVDHLQFYGNATKVWTNASEKVDVTGWVFNYGLKTDWGLSGEWAEEASAAINFRSVWNSIDNTVSAGRAQFPGDNHFTVVDLAFRVVIGEMFCGKASVVSGVRNLFNKKYKEPFFDMYQPGANAFVAFEVDL